MSVDTATRKVSFNGDGIVVAFPFTFRALTAAPTDIKCKETNRTTGTTRLLTYTTEYTVAVNANGVGGTATLTTATSTGIKLTIYRETTDEQASDYNDYNQFPADTLENDLDIRTMKSQEVLEDVERSVKFDITSAYTSPTLPIVSAGKGLMWGATAGTIVNSTDNFNDIVTNASHYATTASTAATAAQLAQTGAETAETNAETAETNAKASEIVAATAATTATAAKVAAATSATLAGNYATTATTSGIAAATSATLAGNYATTATTSMIAAATSATLAGNYATTSSTNATAAGNYATTASTQATAAATSATAALASQVAAATSATAALASQVAAATSATLAGNYATTSTTSQIAAATSATLAGNYATTASTQATAAATSATLSGNYATTASTNAIAAATSATAALTSQVAAATSATAALASQVAAATSATTAAASAAVIPAMPSGSTSGLYVKVKSSEDGYELGIPTTSGGGSLAKVINIAASGGDYTTIQAALNANPTAGTTFLVAPGTYTEAVTFTADNQSIIATGGKNVTTITQAAATAVAFSVKDNCRIEGFTISLTAADANSDKVMTGASDSATSTCYIVDCDISWATTSNLTGAGQYHSQFTDGGWVFENCKFTQTNSFNDNTNAQNLYGVNFGTNVHSLEMINCTFETTSSCVTSCYHYGINGSLTGTVTLRDCKATINSVHTGGNATGFYFDAASTVDLFNCKSTVTTTGAGDARGISVTGATVNVYGGFYAATTGDADGDAIKQASGSVTVYSVGVGGNALTAGTITIGTILV